MKPPTVFLGEMTDPEVEAFLARSRTVIVPVGSTEQHGPHAPLGTDVLIPVEVARRVAPRVDAVVAPSINYALSYPHVGFTGVVHIRIPTFMSLIEDVTVSLAAIGFRRIVFLNGHYDNTYAIAYACATAAERLSRPGPRAFPVNYWDGMTPAGRPSSFDPSNGLHANPARRPRCWPSTPRWWTWSVPTRRCRLPGRHQPGARAHGVLLSAPGSVHRATQLRDLGRCAPGDARVRRALPPGRGGVHDRLLDDIDRPTPAMPAPLTRHGGATR